MLAHKWDNTFNAPGGGVRHVLELSCKASGIVLIENSAVAYLARIVRSIRLGIHSAKQSGGALQSPP